jgi:hypothetical protein
MGSMGCDALVAALETTTAPAVGLTTGAVETVPVVACIDFVVTFLFTADVVRPKLCSAELSFDALETAFAGVALDEVFAELVWEAAETVLSVTWLLFFLPEQRPS